jgi:hypothetical protein
MPEQQLDFFSDISVGAEHPLSRDTTWRDTTDHRRVSAGTMDNESLIAAIPGSTLADTCSITVEVGAGGWPQRFRRRRFTRFGARAQSLRTGLPPLKLLP